MRSYLPLALVFLTSACGSGSTGVTADDAGADDSALDAPPDTATADSGVDTLVAPVDAEDAGDLGVGDAADVATDTGLTWPSCDSKPDGATTSTIAAIWAAEPKPARFTWVSGAVVTAVSYGGCVSDKACQIFVQEGSATTLAEAAKKAIKVFVSAKAASRFTGIAAGDRVDVAAWAWRYDVGGQNELLLQVNDVYRGCAKKTGTGTITPVPATLAELGSVAAYETQYGPVLVKVSNVSGKTEASLSSTFALWPTGGFDAGTSAIVSLSPHTLPSGTFTGLATSLRYDFSSVTGVFGMFIPTGGGVDGGAPSKYLELYPRSMSEMVIK